MEFVALILNYNDSNRTKKLAENILSFGFDCKIVIVDNNSSDEKHILCELREKNVDIIFQNENLYYAGGTQSGLQYIFNNYLANYILIVNSDVSFEKNALEQCIEVHKNKSDVGVCSPLMLDYKGNIDSTGFWEKKNYNNMIKFCFFLGRRKKQKIKIEEKIQMCDCIRGSFQLFSFETLKRIGGYDTNVFLYYEEDIIGHKLACINKKCYVCTNVYYQHNHIQKHSYYMKSFKIGLKDMYYYYLSCFNPSIISIIFLKICMALGCFEHIFIDIFLKLKNRRGGK